MLQMKFHTLATGTDGSAMSMMLAIEATTIKSRVQSMKNACG